MDPTTTNQPAINEMTGDIVPVGLPDTNMTLPDRVAAIEEDLDIIHNQ